MGKRDEETNKTNDTIKQIYSYSSTGFLCSYLIIAFVLCDLNFINWGFEARSGCVLFGLAIALITCGIDKDLL